MGHLMSGLWQRLIMKLLCSLWVQREIKLILPSELKTSATQSIVPRLSARVPLGKIRGMGSYLIGDNADLHIIPVRKSKVLLRCHVT